MMFDTLKASQQLQDAGFDEARADAVVTVFADVSRQLVTRAVLQDELRTLEHRLTVRGAMIFGAVAAFLTALMSIATAILLAAG